MLAAWELSNQNVPWDVLKWGILECGDVKQASLGKVLQRAEMGC